MPLRLIEAQVLNQYLQDRSFVVALTEFFREQRKAFLADLVSAVRLKDRNTMREAYLAGKIDAAETDMLELQHFAERMLKEASQ